MRLVREGSLGCAEEGPHGPCPANHTLILRYKSHPPPASCHHSQLLQLFSQEKSPAQPLKMAFIPAPGYQPTYNPVRYPNPGLNSTRDLHTPIYPHPEPQRHPSVTLSSDLPNTDPGASFTPTLTLRLFASISNSTLHLTDPSRFGFLSCLMEWGWRGF